MKISNNKTPKIKITIDLIREQSQKYQTLKETVADCNKEIKAIEAILKSEDNKYSEIDTKDKVLVISLADAPKTFNLKLFKEEHPKLKWNDEKYFTQGEQIKKITFRKQ